MSLNRFAPKLRDMFNAIYTTVAGTTPDFEKAVKLARKDKLGCYVMKVGPVGFRSNLALLVGSTSLDVTNQQVRFITNLDEPGARRDFDSIADGTGSNFFLSLSNEDAKPFRVRAMQFFNSKNTISESENAVHELLRRIEIYNTTGDKTLPLRKMIKLSVSSVVSKIMFGFEYTDKLDQLMDRIENLAPDYSRGSSIFTSINPSRIQERSEIKSAIDAFIDEYVTSAIVEMQSDPDRLNNSNNFLELTLADIIKDKFEGDPHRVAVDSLIDNPDIRLCISGLLAARNISQLITTALTIYQLPVLCRLVTENCSSSTRSLDKRICPYLHAFFLEVLRLNPSSPLIRYTKEGIENEYLSIPPNSTIIFSLAHAMQIMFEELPSFDPAQLNLSHYFIRNAAGELILNPKLSSSKSGINMAFGMGLRSCPGSHMAEQIFKIFVGKFLLSVEKLNYKENICVFRTVPNEGRLTDRIVPDSNPVLANQNETPPGGANATEEPPAAALDAILKLCRVQHSDIAKILITFTEKVNVNIEQLMRNIDSAETDINLSRYHNDLLLLKSRFEDNINLFSNRNDLPLTMDDITTIHSTIKKYIDDIKTIILKISDALARYDSRIDNESLASSVKVFGDCADSVLDSLKKPGSGSTCILGDTLKSGLDRIIECQLILFNSATSLIKKDDKGRLPTMNTLFAPNTATSIKSESLTQLDPAKNEESPINTPDSNPSGR